MSMKRKLLKLTFALFATMVCSSVNATVYNGNCGTTGHESEVTWSFDTSTKCLTISGTGAIKTYSTENPTAYPWNDATAVSNFNPKGGEDDAYWTGIESIVIGEGVTNVPDWAFPMQMNCASVTLSSTVTSIGDSSLEECAFTSITLPAGLTTIGNFAFQSSKLTSISIPNSVTSIGTYAFAYSDDLASVTLPTNTSYTTIEEGAFNSLTSLTSITIPANVTTIGDMSLEMTGLTSITIPSTVTTIGQMSFEGCPDLATVTISNGVTTIGTQAFDGCQSITSITIPKSVTSIGSGAFSGCDGITDVYCYADPTNLTWTMDEWFADFKDEQGTNFHVADESAWPRTNTDDSFYYLGQRVTFEEDLANISATPVGEYHWATFYDADKIYEVDANTTIYKASVTEDPKVIITAIEGNNIIPAGTAVILKSTGVPVLTETTTESTGDYSENALQGSDGTIDTDAKRIYCLAYMNDKLAFYKVNGGVPVPAGKAYLHLDAGARGFYDIEEGGTTAIKNIKVGKEDNIYYDLQGRRVLYPKKGLYILNGKKVIIK